jgi:hypothetical protein
MADHYYWYITEACVDIYVELGGVMDLYTYVCTCHVVYLWLILLLPYMR